MKWAVFRIVLVVMANEVVLVGAAPPETHANTEQAIPIAASAQKPEQPGENQRENNGKTFSDAKRLVSLLECIESAKKNLISLENELKTQQEEMEAAAAEFRELDAQYKQQEEQLEQLRETDRATAVEQAQTALENLGTKWELAKERLELAIQTRKNLQQQRLVVQDMLQQGRETLEKLTTPQGADPTEPAPLNSDEKEQPTTTDPKPAETVPAPTPLPTLPGLPSLPSLPGQLPAVKPQEKPEEVVAAEKEAEKAQTAADRAEETLAGVEERLEILDEEIALKREALAAARRRIENAEQTRETLRQELAQKIDADVPNAELAELRRQMAEADARVEQARIAAAVLSRGIDDLLSQQTILLAEQVATLREAEAKRSEAEAKSQVLEALKNPFTFRNIARWLLTYGPQMGFILLGAFVVHLILRLIRPALIRLVHRRTPRGSSKDDERQCRADTIIATAYSAALIILYTVVLLMLLEAANLPIGPLLGGAAVIGLAIAFAAQNLLKDYFTGFMVVLEDQYSINDWVKINDISGRVERVNLRMTVLRDLEGTIHFIPHGTVTTVSNLTHGWSRAVFDIGVAYKEDPDQVMEVLEELGRELRQDPEYSDLILEDPVMLGVDLFGDSAIVIKFYIKTRPLQRWAVKREMLRRIKHKFDELGIEIPFPHRTLYHHDVANELPESEFQRPNRR